MASTSTYPYDMLLNDRTACTILVNDKGSPTPKGACSTCSRDDPVPTTVERRALFGSFSDKNEALHWVHVSECQTCNKQLLIWVNPDWWPWEACLKTRDSCKKGITKVVHHADRLVLYILSQICHSPHDDGVTFDGFSPTEQAKLIWHHGEAMGFYTLKPKGSPYSGSMCDFYALPVLDTIYVRSCGRRQGMATRMLEDALAVEVPSDFGFSSPVSKPMMAVLLQLLLRRPEWRDYLWEVKWTGGDGHRENVWLNIQRMIRQHRQGMGTQDRTDHRADSS